MKQQEKVKQLWVRIILIVLVALMVASLAFYTIWMVINQIREKVDNDDPGSDTDFSEHTDDDGHDHGDEADPHPYY